VTITAADTLAVSFRGTSNSSAMIVSIPARARMRPSHQFARAQHQLAGRDVGAPDPLLNSAAVERRLRRAVQRGQVSDAGHISSRWGALDRRGAVAPLHETPSAGKRWLEDGSTRYLIERALYEVRSRQFKPVIDES
jgi:hypothetical protein